jgi:electron transfer flavoprotein alpha subunit
MSVIVVAEVNNGSFKKAAFEAVHFGHLTAQALGTDCIAIVAGEAVDAGQLGKYGATKVLHVKSYVGGADSQKMTKLIGELCATNDGKLVIFNHSSLGKSLAGRVAIRLKGACVSQVSSIPSGAVNSYTVTKPVFSGKAFATYQVDAEKSVLTVMGNAIPPALVGESCPVEDVNVELSETNLVIKERQTVTGTVPLPEAELVVSAGRGMKGPENWGIIEDLANVIGATTACSRPVADTGWRPHHEHVGQTGVAIRPNLYFAIGISGAIQHLAGVNSSKCIVVINKDPEAPFFKAADYGVCADLFDVVPRLIEAFKKYKAA